MTALLARLIGSPWLLLVSGLALAACGFAGGNAWRGAIAGAALAEARAETAQCRAAQQKARADGAEAAAAALSQAALRARSAMEGLAKKEEAARVAGEQFRQALAGLPETYICGASAAEQAYRRSVAATSDFDQGAEDGR